MTVWSVRRVGIFDANGAVHIIAPRPVRRRTGTKAITPRSAGSSMSFVRRARNAISVKTLPSTHCLPRAGNKCVRPVTGRNAQSTIVRCVANHDVRLDRRQTMSVRCAWRNNGPNYSCNSARVTIRSLWNNWRQHESTIPLGELLEPQLGNCYCNRNPSGVTDAKRFCVINAFDRSKIGLTTLAFAFRSVSSVKTWIAHDTNDPKSRLPVVSISVTTVSWNE